MVSFLMSAVVVVGVTLFAAAVVYVVWVAWTRNG